MGKRGHVVDRWSSIVDRFFRWAFLLVRCDMGVITRLVFNKGACGGTIGFLMVPAGVAAE